MPSTATSTAIRFKRHRVPIRRSRLGPEKTKLNCVRERGMVPEKVKTHYISSDLELQTYKLYGSIIDKRKERWARAQARCDAIMQC